MKFDPANAQAHATGGELRPESVIHVHGPVQQRPPGTENKELATGEVEVDARTVTTEQDPLRAPALQLAAGRCGEKLSHFGAVGQDHFVNLANDLPKTADLTQPSCLRLAT